VDGATVVGHSLGGGVAMQFAYQFPYLCERLVLIGTGGVARDVHPLLRALAVPGAETMLSVVTRAPMRLLTQLCTPVLLRSGGLGMGSDLHYVLERYQSLADEPTRRAFLRTLRSVVDARGQVVTMMDRCYLTSGMPTLLIWGDQDRVVPVRHAHLAHAAMPGSRLEIFPGAGHFPHQADPDRFIGLIEDFHDGTEPAEYEQARWRALLEAGPDDEPRASGS
jgi:pimeloyl-ACP methyl ester carboxylesterase